MSVKDFPLESLVMRAIKNARARHTGEHERWVAVSDTFGLGSTYAIELCQLYGMDPHEKIQGPRCLACNP
jgi:hypothetical protein